MDDDREEALCLEMDIDEAIREAFKKAGIAQKEEEPEKHTCKCNKSGAVAGGVLAGIIVMFGVFSVL